MADDGGDTYQEAVPDWVFYPAAVVALGLGKHFFALCSDRNRGAVKSE